MIPMLRAMFGRILLPPPCKGDIYILNPIEDPWGRGQDKVEIIDAGKGWVRYKFCNSDSLFQDERLELGSFNYCYKKETK